MNIELDNLQAQNTSNLGQISEFQIPGPLLMPVSSDFSISNSRIDPLPVDEVSTFATWPCFQTKCL